MGEINVCFGGCVMEDPPISKKLGEAVVVLRDVKKHYLLDGNDETVKALDGVTLCPESEFYPVRAGEFVMLRGASGQGKTTLLNVIGTIDRQTDGSVELLGTTLDASCKDVFQTFNLLATMSAFENVELPMVILGKLNRKERK